MKVRILHGHVMGALRSLPNESVNCVVTSPPYWGLRSYGIGADAGEIGLEPTLAEHLLVLVNVFREVRRVLRADGTCWINYGDCYATTPNGRSAAATKAAGNDDRTFRDKPFSTVGPICAPDYEKTPRAGKTQNRGNLASQRGSRIVAGGYLKPKDLCMLSNRLAIALQDDGWWVRSEIIWYKLNPMPESVIDRPACAHEKVWLLSKSARYWYDADAVRTAVKEADSPAVGRHAHGSGSVLTFDDDHASAAKRGEKRIGSTRGRSTYGRHTLGDAVPEAERRDKVRGLTPRHEGHVNHTGIDGTPRGEGAHLRNVWPIAITPYAGAHFATFPPALVRPCILAGCPENGTVLDPFGGSGTVGLVASCLNRHSILIDLSHSYTEMMHTRLQNEIPLLADISVERIDKNNAAADH